MKLSSANSFNLVESKICRLGKGKGLNLVYCLGLFTTQMRILKTLRKNPLGNVVEIREPAFCYQHYLLFHNALYYN